VISSFVLHVRPDDGLIEKGPKHVCLSFDSLRLNKVLLCLDLPTLYHLWYCIYIYIVYIGLHVKYPFLLSYFSESWNFSTDFGKPLRYQISCKSAWWEPSFSMRTARQTGMNKLTVALRNFANELNNALFFLMALFSRNRYRITTHYLPQTLYVAL
jgi:hypothetical protein